MSNFKDIDFRDYLGDSVYADYDGYYIVLTTNNGLGATNAIVLDPHVYEALMQYSERIQALIELDQASEKYVS